MDGWISLLLGSIRDHHLSPVWAGGRGEEGGGRREEVEGVSRGLSLLSSSM